MARRADPSSGRRKPPPAAPATGALPSLAELRSYLAQAPKRLRPVDIARAFAIPLDQRRALRALLRDLAAEGGGLISTRGQRSGENLPETLPVEITGTDRDGDPLARPLGWLGSDGPPPLILMAAEKRGQPALAPGDRVLARLRQIGASRYEGRTIARLNKTQTGRILGVYRAGAKEADGGRIAPTDRRAKAEWLVAAADRGEAEDGELVRATPLPAPRYGLKSARITERLGRLGEARSVSLLCIHTHDIPHEFPTAALEEAAQARATPHGQRTDLREMPLVTIDGADARDFDDAVHAIPEANGFAITIAIADVAHYVRPGSALDQTARLRGNSVYFPDRVVPMLPEALSNHWCSLRPDEERGCLFVTIRIAAEGEIVSWRFGRGLMRSAARLTYEDAQRAADGDATAAPEGVIAPLYAAYHALAAARARRGTLELDLPERQVFLNEEGQVDAIRPRPRLHSHRLIEEFMIAANVCAAAECEKLRQACLYRVHAPPSDEKLLALRQFLHGFGISLPPGQQIHPRQLAGALEQFAGKPEAQLISEVMLRSQSQAAYSPDNIGHFGLALPRYAHFTSPIRRYADLQVHRALIAGLKLGPGGGEIEDLEDLGGHLGLAERRAALAEREAIDRYLAAYLADHVGARFPARISGVTRFGLFVSLAETGASGLVPLSSLPDDHWVHDESQHMLTGRHSRRSFRLAEAVVVRLAEASALTGSLNFRLELDGMPPGATDSPLPAATRSTKPARHPAPPRGRRRRQG